MPLDDAHVALFHRPFIPYVRPPRIVWADGDEAMLADLDAGWQHLRGPIDPKDDDTSDRWDDDDAGSAPRSTRLGLPVSVTADALSIPHAAFVALCDHHGILALRRHRGQQRRLVTPAAKRDGLGWNVSPRVAIAGQRGVSFPVFDPLALDGLALIFGWPDVLATVAAMTTRQQRRDYLLTHHAYLPDAVVGDLSGYARSAVQKARQALTVSL